MEYSDIIENTINRNGDILAINQHNQYNYNTYVKDKEKAETKYNRLMVILISVVIGFSILSFVYVYKRLSHRFTSPLNIPNQCKSTFIDDKGTEPYPITVQDNSRGESTDDVIEKHKASLTEIACDSNAERDISDIIIQSDAYKEILSRIHNNEEIGEDDMLWDNIEKVVVTSSQNFSMYYQNLFLSQLNKNEIHTIFLIKCGISPSKMAKLFNQTKNCISSRRDTIGKKVLNGKFSTKDVDRVIRYL